MTDYITINYKLWFATVNPLSESEACDVHVFNTFADFCRWLETREDPCTGFPVRMEDMLKKWDVATVNHIVDAAGGSDVKGGKHAPVEA